MPASRGVNERFRGMFFQAGGEFSGDPVYSWAARGGVVLTGCVVLWQYKYSLLVDKGQLTGAIVCSHKSKSDLRLGS